MATVGKKTTLHAVLYISWPSLHDYDMEREQRPPLFCPELLYSPLKFTPEKIAKIWRIEGDEISAMSLKTAQTRFVTYVFVAVAVVVG